MLVSTENKRTISLRLGTRAVSLVVGILVLPATVSGAFAQAFVAPPSPPGTTDNNAQFASRQTLLDLGSNFLRRAGDQATWGYNAGLQHNPGGGGAPAGTLPPVRSWSELYGISARDDAQAAFVGDRRRTYGGVAGLAATILPGLEISGSIDQSATNIDVPLVSQSADLALTQAGFSAVYTAGAWTLDGTYVHGWGNINSQRATFTGPALANYGGRLDGALGEVSYFWGLGQSRIVPKIGVQYISAETNAFREFNGFNPVSAGNVSGERAQVLAGAEIGHYWVIDRHVLDISAYAKFIDNFVQTLSPVALTANGQTITVQGFLESRTGADAGAAISYGLSKELRIYANYDGRFRANLSSQQAR